MATTPPRIAAQLVELTKRASGPEDQLVKSMGDAVMCASTTPISALRMIARLFALASTQPVFPLLRAGAHHGPATERDGDYFGTTVNTTARIGALAAPGELLITPPLLVAAEELHLPMTPRGPHQLRNIVEPMDITSVELACCDHAAIIDPVCLMRVEPARAFATDTYEEHEYTFCSSECLDAFKASLTQFAR
jgi:adenylate cyclase